MNPFSSFITSIQNAPGFDEAAFIATHESGQQIVSIRINPAKANIQDSSFNLLEKVPWSSHGYYLKERPSFTLDPLFHAGAYYVQEASSMFLEEAIRQSCDLTRPLRVLDLCAAPGGKSTLIQSIISEESLLVSNELIKTRVNILAENIAKWGAANVIVTNNDPVHFKRLPQFFDLIIVDAPCSGSGLFRKDPEAIEEWSLNNVELCSQRQHKILSDIEGSLKPGAVLIYSTCSYSQKENEEIIDWMIEHFTFKSLQLANEESWGIVETLSEKNQAYGYRFYPDKVKGEGFFISVFKKRGEPINSKDLRSKIKPSFINSQEELIAKNYILNAEKYRFIKFGTDILVFPAALMDAFLLLQSVLYFKKAGVQMGAIIRNELLPYHDWAVSSIAQGIIQTVEVDIETALDYLRRKDFNITSSKNGWAIISFKNISLGLVKIIPGRINNYYPREWRILNK